MYARADVNFGNDIMYKFDIFAYILNFSLFPWKMKKLQLFKFSFDQIAAHMHVREFMIF